MTNPLETMIQLLQILIPLIAGTILFSSTLISKRNRLMAILLIIGLSSPYIYSLFYEQAPPAIERNLELSILYVWSCSGILMILAFIRIYLRIKGQK